MNIYQYLFFILLLACADSNKTNYKEAIVPASAYNSVYWQTKKNNPSVAAWGDTLKPGMKVIAVSRDLIDSGLTHNTKVFIKELNDTFLVKDKMNRRWTKKIDLYMGKDIQKAREFGKKKLTIQWEIKE